MECETSGAVESEEPVESRRDIRTKMDKNNKTKKCPRVQGSTVYRSTASVSGVGSLFGSSKDISEQGNILDYKFNLFKFIKNMDYKDEAPIEYTFNLFKFIKNMDSKDEAPIEFNFYFTKYLKQEMKKRYKNGNTPEYKVDRLHKDNPSVSLFKSVYIY